MSQNNNTIKSKNMKLNKIPTCLSSGRQRMVLATGIPPTTAHLTTSGGQVYGIRDWYCWRMANLCLENQWQAGIFALHR